MSGLLLVAASTVGFVYWSLWILVTPFVEEDQPLLRFFPDRYYGIIIPCMAFSMLLGSVLLFVGGVLLFEQRKRWTTAQALSEGLKHMFA
eukprot:jgi/Botrbrau1/6722/Bobra.0324s0013.1